MEVRPWWWRHSSLQVTAALVLPTQNLTWDPWRRKRRDMRVESEEPLRSWRRQPGHDSDEESQM